MFDQKLPRRRKVGDTLTAIVSGAGETVAYYWMADGKLITSGNYKPILVVTEDMIGKKISVEVVSLPGGETATSDETAPVTMFEELELESVESAGRITDPTTRVTGVNILVAYFSSEMDEINPADVEIRRVSDNRLFTVEKVTMTSDGLTATMTLTGTAAAASGTEYLQGNTPYRMIVKNGDTTLEKEFVVPVIEDNAVVTAVDPDNAKLELNGTEYELGEGVTVNNYFELLGKTVTAEVDETGKITTYNVAKLKSVTGKFKYTAGTATAPATFKEVVSGTVYKTTDGAVPNLTTYATQTVQYNNKFAPGAIDVDGTAGTDIPATDLEWGRLVFNPDGTIRTVMGIATLPNSAYVTANDDGIIKNGASVKVNVKDFVIISGDETIEATDLIEGDVFIYNAADQVGYVYDNPIEGTFTKNYGAKYVFAGKEYSQNVTDLKDQKEANLTSDAVDDLIKAKTEMTLYTNIAGDGVYAIGEAAALTSTVKLFATSSGTSGTGDVAEASVTGFNPATGEMETYAWTGESMISFTTVASWDSATHKTQVPKLVKITVNAEDGTTVKKVEEVDEAFAISVGPTFLDGKDTTDATSGGKIEEITKSTKLIGSDATNGMDPAKSKVVVYKNPAKDDKAWAASNFTVYDFSDWSGKLVESAATSGLFSDTHIYGTLSKSVEFLFANGATTAQKNAGAVGVEAGTPFVGFVTEKLDGSSKRVKAITAEGEQTYETFYEENKTASLTAAVVGTFVVITPSKTFDDDDTIFSMATLTGAGTYANVTNADYAAYASNGATLTTCKNDATAYKDFDVASDALVIKKTVKDGNTSYALATATAIKQFAPVAVYNATGNTTIAKMVLFAEPDTAAGDADAISTKAALTDGTGSTADQKGGITAANTAREAEKAAIDAITATIANSVTTTTATVTLTDPQTYGGTNALTTVTNTNGKTAGTVGFNTPKLVATYTANTEGNGAVDEFGITLTGTYYVRTISYSATVDNAAATHTTTLTKLDDTTTLRP